MESIAITYLCILQPSFIGSFNIVDPRHLPTRTSQKITCSSFKKFSVRATCGRGSVILWPQCNVRYVPVLVVLRTMSCLVDRLRCCQLRWTISMINWWRSSVTSLSHWPRRHLRTTRRKWGTASRGSVSGSGDLSLSSRRRAHAVFATVRSETL